MILKLRDIRDLISSLNIVEDEHCFCGKLENKKNMSIGCYPSSDKREKQKTIGNISSYRIKGVTFLIHGNMSPTDTEDIATTLYEKLEETKNITVNKQLIMFIQMPDDEPISVGTDENGIYEYVINCFIYYERR